MRGVLDGCSGPYEGDAVAHEVGAVAHEVGAVAHDRVGTVAQSPPPPPLRLNQNVNTYNPIF